MHINWFNHFTSEQEFSRTVLHEFGHALGLQHEHQRRNANINWSRYLAYLMQTCNLNRKYETQQAKRFSIWDDMRFWNRYSHDLIRYLLCIIGYQLSVLSMGKKLLSLGNYRKEIKHLFETVIFS